MVTRGSAVVTEEPAPVSRQGGPMSPDRKAHPAHALLQGGSHRQPCSSIALCKGSQMVRGTSQLHPCPLRVKSLFLLKGQPSWALSSEERQTDPPGSCGIEEGCWGASWK